MQAGPRQAFYLYLESISGMILGYAYIISVSRLAGPEAIGAAGVTASLGLILSNILGLGIPWVLPKFLGRANASELGNDKISDYFNISITLSTISIIAFVPLFIVFGEHLSDILSLTYDFLILAVIVMATSLFGNIFRATLLSLFNSKSLLIATLVGSLSKIGLTILLLMLGWGALGAAYGHVAHYTLMLLILTSATFVVIRKRILIHIPTDKSKIRNVLDASLSSWFPTIIILLGTDVGVIAVFGSSGAADAGVYYVSMAIYSAVTAVSSSLLGVSFPMISGMQYGKEKLSWRVTRLGLVSSMPLAAVIFFFPEIILELLGPEFKETSLPLAFLMLSVMPYEFSKMIYHLSYAMDRYKYALYLGLSTNLPRLGLYLALVPTYGSTGASISFLIGSLAGLIASFIISKRLHMHIDSRQLVLLSAIPFLIGSPLTIFNVNFAFVMFLIIFVSFIMYARLNLIDSVDVSDILSAMLPKNKAAKYSIMINGILAKLRSW